MQLELFQPDPKQSAEHRRLLARWRQELASWPAEVWRWRHYRYTTGWSMASGWSYYCNARELYREWHMTRAEFRRWWRFHRRVRRWDAR